MHLFSKMIYNLKILLKNALLPFSLCLCGNLCKLAPKGMSQWIYSIQLMIEALQTRPQILKLFTKVAEKS